MNIVNGGAHADNPLDFQEFMIAPHGADSFAEAIRKGEETFHALKAILHGKGYSTGVGDEGGFAPDLKSNGGGGRGHPRGDRQSRPEAWRGGLALPRSRDQRDVGERQVRPFQVRQSTKTSEEMVKLWESWVRQYPIVLIEDGLAENDWQGWKILTSELGARVELVGDDIFCTNPEILERGIDEGVGNSILIKLNQIGTVTETLATVELAQRNNYNCFVSHRSGETEDTTIADLTVAIGAGHLKTGSGCRGERIAKFNQLLRIERGLGKAARFAGKATFKHAAA